MKPTPDALRAACPDVDERLILGHLERLGDAYFQRFDETAIARHLMALSALSTTHPVELQLETAANGRFDCTIFAFDSPGLFSLITGVLAGLEFQIQSGDVFTYARLAPAPAARQRRPGRRPAPDPWARRRIIDCFGGTVASRDPIETWEDALRDSLHEVLVMIEGGQPDAVQRAKSRVNEMVTQHIARLKHTGIPVLFPVDIQIENTKEAFTHVKVISQDTPAFLYSLSAALSLHALSIEQVRIRTVEDRVEDDLALVDEAGMPILNSRMLDKVRLSILLTKQFTYFLDKAPDGFAALSRFEHLIEEITRLPESVQWLDALSNPRTMQDLAQVLGASDYLWEDFIRLQYETLLPMLTAGHAPDSGGEPDAPVADRLAAALAAAQGLEEKRRRLNEFKDREIFRADLDYILSPDVAFRAFAERLTDLAEAVVNAAADMTYNDMVRRFGRPCTVAGLPATFAILGLGKLGGAALGYASDIELIFVYGDSGHTDGATSVTNAEFYERMVRQTTLSIEAKREGIFRVDMRLRPHGNSGPMASSLESFVGYYGTGGPAHSVERLALVRMRAFGGDRELGARLERLRDEFIYASPTISLPELRETRARQFKEKERPGAYNAKFSPGALVDLEYAVQILQVMHAKSLPTLRTPRIHKALEEMQRVGVLDPVESARLIAAYDFLRILINGLRMLRGSAVDLYLPAEDADEYLHLARRIGYVGNDELDPAQQLHLDFATDTAAVRVFVEQHFGRASLPGPAMGNVADLVLSDGIPKDLRRRILRNAGFENTDRAYANLRALAGEGRQRDMFARLAVLACDILGREPAPDMALNNWDRFARVLPESEHHIETLLAQPRRLEILLGIFSRSQFLARTLMRHVSLWNWITDPVHLQHVPGRDELAAELRASSREHQDRDAWRMTLRQLRQRELLRIGTLDMCLHENLPAVARSLSVLADAIVEAALERAWDDEAGDDREVSGLRDRFCVLALGKLGGNELNYSSDIDLLGVYDDAKGEGQDKVRFTRILSRMSKDLSNHTAEGIAYRVDFRLRPYGRAGSLVSSLSDLVAYYASRADLWEVQALLKLRFIAGSAPLGATVLRRLHPELCRKRPAEHIAAMIGRLRGEAVRKTARSILPQGLDVKNAEGGIRDIEFIAQGRQLQTAHACPDVLTGNTLDALARLRARNAMEPAVQEELSDHYVYLRRVEHCLQIMGDRQVHALPANPEALLRLARQMQGRDARVGPFCEEVGARMKRVREHFLTFVSDSAEVDPAGP